MSPTRIYKQKNYQKGKTGIFLIATYGEGDPTDNSKEFFKCLKGKTSKEMPDLRGFQFTVFALGSTQYEHYCGAGKQADNLLQLRGGQRIFDLGLGDNNSSIQQDFKDWKKELWNKLQSLRPVLQQNYRFIETDLRSYLQNNSLHQVKDLTQIKFAVTDKKEDRPKLTFSFDFKNYLKSQQAQVNILKQIRQKTDLGQTYNIGFKMAGSYKPADNIYIYPQNSDELVQRVMNYFGLDSKLEIQLIPKNEDICLHYEGGLVSSLLKTRVDLTKQLKSLSQFPFLPRNSKKPQISTLFQWISFNKVKISFGLFLNYCDVIKPRPYTICSGDDLNTVEIAIKLQKLGLFSQQVMRMKLAEKIRFFIKPSGFSNFLRWKKVIMIATGTGLAPFRAFLQAKSSAMKQGIHTPDLYLYFGCCHQNGDFIFKQEILDYLSKGILNYFKPAFSRDTPTKQYVTHKLKDDREIVNQVLLKEDQGAVYICGSVQMGKQVSNSLRQILSDLTKSKKDLLKTMQQQQRIVKELW